MAESVLKITAKISRVFDVDELDRSYHVWAKDRTFNGADIFSRPFQVVTTSSSSGLVKTKTVAK